jgi:histidinol-phosphate aminotransferase
VAALEDEDHLKETLERIKRTRERMKKELAALGFSMPDSQSNFLFITHERVPAKELFEMLRERHIYVRYFDKPRIDNMLRVTIGTDDEMDQFIACLKEYLC